MDKCVYAPFDLEETIAAICTPPGIGGIAIIRITGKNALEIADQLFSGSVLSYQSHTCHFGTIFNNKKERIDDALLIVMHGKKSFTGQTTVEIQCHGGDFASHKILKATIQAGARLARPGEFSLRAFLNGKIDLTQAEAIQELIFAKNEQAFSLATKQLAGALSSKIKYFQKKLVKLAAILEAWVDFPEEGLEFTTPKILKEDLENIRNEIEILSATFEDGQKIHSGISLCIIGPPNAGKSSLMNSLLRQERAIVTPIPGTTRDLLEEDLLLKGVHFRLIDTAGIRKTRDKIEEEGIRRAIERMKAADGILLLLDASRSLNADDWECIKIAPPEKTLLVWNKTDLPHSNLPAFSFPSTTHISAKEGKGLDLLSSAIGNLVWKQEGRSQEEVVIVSMRHKEFLEKTIHSCDAVIQGLDNGLSPEFLAFEMRMALKNLGGIIGMDLTEDILSSIFSQFCIGK